MLSELFPDPCEEIKIRNYSKLIPRECSHFTHRRFIGFISIQFLLDELSQLNSPIEVGPVS